jgi:predicted ATP-dependent protease
MTCPCISNNPENRFTFLYTSLQEIIELYKYEEYFRQELGVLENVRDDYPALIQWLKKNEKLGAEDFFLFWIE